MEGKTRQNEILFPDTNCALHAKILYGLIRKYLEPNLNHSLVADFPKTLCHHLTKQDPSIW